jgi:hypothetical protein
MKLGLRDRTLNHIREQVGRNLPDRALLEVEQGTTGSYGEPLHAWQVVESDVPCRLLPVGRGGGSSGAAQQLGMQETIVQTRRLILPTWVSVGVDYRVTIRNEAWHVVGLLGGSDAVFVEVLVKRAEG